MKKTLMINNLKSIAFAIVVVFAISASAVGTWNDPSSGPEGASFPIPLNPSASLQIKDGGLSVNRFAATGVAQFSQQVFAAGSLFGETSATSPTLKVGDNVRQVDVAISGNVKASNSIKASNVLNTTNNKLCADAVGKIVLCGVIVDLCLNIPGNQTTIPTGLESDGAGNCITDPDPVGPGGGTTVTNSFATCFVADTLVTLSDGSKKNIQDVKIGDILKGETGNNTVLAYHRPKLEGMVYSFNKGRYFVTEEHPFMTTQGWKSINPTKTKLENIGIEVGSLAVGDTLVTDHGLVLLESLEGKSESPDTDLYNFMLSGDRTYFADGYLVHNKTACSTGGYCGDTNFCIDSSGQPSLTGSSCSISCVYGSTPSSGTCPAGKTRYCGIDNKIHCQ